MSENGRRSYIIKSYQQRTVEALERIADALEKGGKRKRHNWEADGVPGFWRCTKCGATTQNTMEAERKLPCL